MPFLEEERKILWDLLLQHSNLIGTSIIGGDFNYVLSMKVGLLAIQLTFKTWKIFNTILLLASSRALKPQSITTPRQISTMMVLEYFQSRINLL